MWDRPDKQLSLDQRRQEGGMPAPYNLPTTLSSIYTLTSPYIYHVFLKSTPPPCKHVSIWLNSIPLNPPPDTHRQTHTPPLLPFVFLFRVGGQRGERGSGSRKGEGPASAAPAGWSVGGSGAAPPVIIRVTAARPDCVLPAPGEMFCPGRRASICLSLPVDSNLLPACPTQPN